MHPDDGRIQRLLDGELEPEEEEWLRDHIAACGECRGRIARAEAEDAAVSGLLRSLDHDAPVVDARAMVARARGRGSRAAGRWAAGIVLAIGAAGAAYAVPGSPLPGWIEAAGGWIGGDAEPSDPREMGPQATDPAISGISVLPGDDFLVVFSTPQREARAVVSLVDARELSVRAAGGAPPTFTSEPDRLLIDNRDPAGFEIEIPRDAPRVEIRMKSYSILLKEGAEVTAMVAPDTNGRYHLPLAPAGP